MRLGDLLYREPVTCSPETSLKEAVHLMRLNDVGSVVVVRGGKAVGIFTERDLVRAVDEGADMGRPVSEFMTPDLVVAHPEESVESALQKMLRHGIRHLPVVTPDMKVIGVLSIRDLVEAMLEEATPL
ncbi:MAG: CBS domain-containing protein [Crenarchaeota archaeon]|nr:CBS domain-containing protein [Thermoproteota archaeon]